MSPLPIVASKAGSATVANVAVIRADVPGLTNRPRLAFRANANKAKLNETLDQITVAVVECPFCGSDEVKIEELDGANRISCCRCHSVGPIARSARDAIERSGWLFTNRSTFGGLR